MKPRRPSPGYDVDVPPGRRLTLAIATCFLAASVGAGEAPPSKLPPKTPRNGEPFVLPDASPASEPLTAPAEPAHEDWLPGRAWVLVLAGGASLAAAALFAHRSRVHRMLELERVRTRIATDLHDDIGAGLSQVAILSELAQRRAKGAPPEMLHALERIALVSRELVDSMSDIVWAVDPHRDTMGDLVHRMRRFASDVFTARDVAFTFDVNPHDNDVALPADLRRQVYLVFKEAVNNAA